MYLTQQNFYFGAILSAIIEYNPDASMAMLQRNDDHRGIYRIETNTSQTCCFLFKHAGQKRENIKSWQFLFSDEELDFLEKCHNDKTPTFIYLLCRTPELKSSEIAVLNLIEFRNLNKSSITVRYEKRSFIISGSSYAIPRNRIQKDFDTLINEVVEDSSGYYCPKCKIPLISLTN